MTSRQSPNDEPILGYVVCPTCKTLKAIRQGTGKRSAYVKGRCECGPDNRTGKAAQAEMSAYVPLREAEVKLNALLNPKDTPVVESESKTDLPNGSQKIETQVKKESQSNDNPGSQSGSQPIDNNEASSVTSVLKGAGLFGVIAGLTWGAIKVLKG